MPFASANAAAQCPVGATVNQNTTFASTHSYSIVNDSDQDILVSVQAEVRDSDGNNASDGRFNELVPAHSSASGNLSLFLTAAYASPGVVSVTASTNVFGGASATGVGFCSFAVAAQVAPTFEISPMRSGGGAAAG
jgi:hypothetical protein